MMSTPDAAPPDAVITASEPVGPAQGPPDAAPAPSREAMGSFSLERAKSSLRRRREREQRRRGWQRGGRARPPPPHIWRGRRAARSGESAPPNTARDVQQRRPHRRLHTQAAEEAAGAMARQARAAHVAQEDPLQLPQEPGRHADPHQGSVREGHRGGGRARAKQQCRRLRQVGGGGSGLGGASRRARDRRGRSSGRARKAF